jgi:hypothetical protein
MMTAGPTLTWPGPPFHHPATPGVLLTARAVAIDTVQPGRLARVLAGCVRPRTDSRGLSVPERD